MRAIVAEEFGGYQNLKLADIPSQRCRMDAVAGYEEAGERSIAWRVSR